MTSGKLQVANGRYAPKWTPRLPDTVLVLSVTPDDVARRVELYVNHRGQMALVNDWRVLSLPGSSQGIHAIATHVGDQFYQWWLHNIGFQELLEEEPEP